MSARIISLAGVRAARRPRYRPEPVDPRRFARFAFRETWGANLRRAAPEIAARLGALVFFAACILIWMELPG